MRDKIKQAAENWIYDEFGDSDEPDSYLIRMYESAYNHAIEEYKKKILLNGMYSDEEIETARNVRDFVIKGHLSEFKSIYMAGEIVAVSEILKLGGIENN